MAALPPLPEIDRRTLTRDLEGKDPMASFLFKRGGFLFPDAPRGLAAEVAVRVTIVRYHQNLFQRLQLAVQIFGAPAGLLSSPDQEWEDLPESFSVSFIQWLNRTFGLSIRSRGSRTGQGGQLTSKSARTICAESLRPYSSVHQFEPEVFVDGFSLRRVSNHTALSVRGMDEIEYLSPERIS